MVGNHEQVHGRDVRRMVAKEGTQPCEDGSHLLIIYLATVD